MYNIPDPETVRREIDASYERCQQYGVNPAFQESKRMAMTAALSKSTVLLLGETGTGKELFAQSIYNQSLRKDHPLLAINCGAIPRELLESELFGYVEGSFTGARRGGGPGKFELADGGSVKFNLSNASHSFGISRATLYNKIKKFNLAISRQSV